MQEAWIRWQSTQAPVRSPKAFLTRLVTRLCIDQLRSARVQREQYVGTWLPEPLIASLSGGGEDHTELAESLSFAFLMLLECLSPTERAIFLLREVFDYAYSDIAPITGKSVANCRQIVHRARQHLVQRRPSPGLPLHEQEELVEHFLTRWHQGDVQGLIALMAEDVTFWSDGGGQVTAAQYPLQGCQKVAQFLVALRRSRLIPAFHSQLVLINHQPGIINTVAGKLQSTVSFDFSGDKIQAMFAVVNPEKLKAAEL
jgi:RNA polymerase sigma-70 factor (ECF subfamily)